MDLPQRIVESPLVQLSDNSVDNRNPPEIHVVHPCIPDSDSASELTPMTNSVFTIEDTRNWPVSSAGFSRLRMSETNLLNTYSLPGSPSPATWDRISYTSYLSQPQSRASYSLEMDKSVYIYEKIHALVTSLTQRAQRVKRHIVRPLTPSSYCSDNGQGTSAIQRRRLSSLVTFTSSFQSESRENSGLPGSKLSLLMGFLRRLKPKGLLNCFNPFKAVDPQSKLYILWLFFVSICYLYNAWGIFLRAAFPYQTPENFHLWFTFDCVSDAGYLIDLLAVKPRLKILHDGFWITDVKETRQVYMKSQNFWFDTISLLPLDFLYFRYGTRPLLRLPRLVKINTFWEFFSRFDRIASSPYIIRIFHTLMYMLFLIHMNACAYYAYSDHEGIGRPDNQWVYNGEGNAYVRCFLFATKIATSIGKNPQPQNLTEYLFMTVSWLSGIFIFAMMIGQIRDILHVASKSQEEYRKVTDRTLVYMKRLNLMRRLRDRTRLWFTYNWNQQKSLDEGKILRNLPLKMQMDIAMRVHFHILSKVKLFHDFDRTLLRSIVLRMKPYLYLPGGYVCRKGEVGTEMYIVNDGQVYVMGGENDDHALATLKEGSVFGEVSLLSVGHGNRRTTSVISRGFSNLFVLRKDDLHDAIKDYPLAQEMLQRRARRLLKSSNSRDSFESEPCSSSSMALPSLTSTKRTATPRFLRTVLQAVSPYSKTAQMIRHGTRGWQSMDGSKSAPPLRPEIMISPSLPAKTFSDNGYFNRTHSNGWFQTNCSSAGSHYCSDSSNETGGNNNEQHTLASTLTSLNHAVLLYEDTRHPTVIPSMSPYDSHGQKQEKQSISPNTIQCPVVVHRPRSPIPSEEESQLLDHLVDLRDVV